MSIRNIRGSMIQAGIIHAMLLATAPAAPAGSYVAIDSLTVRGITFVAERDCIAYSPTDTVHARLLAVNPTSDTIIWPAQQFYQPSIFFMEQWCTANRDSCRAVTPSVKRGGGLITSVSFSPGRTVVETRAHASEYPGAGWQMTHGAMYFMNPWDYPFSFNFMLFYSRSSTQLAMTAWTQIKALYR